MRLLMTTDTVGGVWSYTRELLKGLLSADISVCLMTLGGSINSDQKSWIEAAEREHPGRFRTVATNYKLEWMEDAVEDIRASRLDLLSLAREFQPDLLHTNQFCFSWPEVAMPTLLVAHSDVRSWWRAVHGCPPPDSAWVRGYTELVRDAIRRADMVVAPTRWMLDEISREYGTPRLARVVANGSSPLELRRGLPKRMRAVTLGRLWDEGKNVRLLESVSSVVPIAIAGDPRRPAGCSGASYTRAERSEHVCLGTLSPAEVRELLLESAIYIATSRYEPFGLAPLEAAMAGCAIVANDIPPLREVWQDDALYFDRDDAASLARVLDRLAADPHLLSGMAARAQQRARDRYTAAEMTSGYMELYSALRIHTAELTDA